MPAVPLSQVAVHLRPEDNVAVAARTIPPGAELHVRVDRLDYVDHACMELLAAWAEQNAEKGSRLVVEWEALRQRHPTGGQPVLAGS